MKPIVGYITKHLSPDDWKGEWGTSYNYVLAHNGLFIAATNELLHAQIPVSECVVRGLSDIAPQVRLIHDRIPQALFDLALTTILIHHEIESYMAITWKDGYHLFKVDQKGTAGSVEYQVLEGTVLELHSHPGSLHARFSPQDDADEQGSPKLSVVIGQLNAEQPEVRIRCSCYGYYYEIPWEQVFEGTLHGAVPAEDEVVRYVLHSRSEAEIIERELGRKDILLPWWKRFLA